MESKWTELRPQIQQIWRLSLPGILTHITSTVMQYIDSAMVGALGAKASAAIGLVSSTTWLINGMAYALAAGFSVQVAHSIGAGQEDEARNVVRHGLVTTLAVSLLTCLFALSISSALPGWLGGEAAIQKDASAYFVTFALMIPFFQMQTLTASFLQCSGDMVTPSVLGALMCLLDVAFNAFFIPRYGVLGAGIGTGLACAVISLCMLWRCCITNPVLGLRGKGRGIFRRKILADAFRIGTPVLVEEGGLCGAMVVSTMIIAPLGSVAIAANSFAVTAEGLCYMPGYGVASAATAVVGRSAGAGDVKLAKRYGNICIAMGGIFMGITAVFMAIVCPFVFTLLTPDPQVRELATQVLRIGLVAEPLFGVAIVAAGALRGTGDTFVPSMTCMGSIWIVRLGLALLLVGRLGLHGMWIAMAAELCLRGLLLLYRQKTTGYYDKFNRNKGSAANIK